MRTHIATASTPLSYQDDARIQRHRWIILIAINLFSLMATLDSSIVNVALPDIGKSLSVPTAETTWIATIYLVVICVLTLFWGRLGDIVGKIKLFKIGMVIFVVGSACSAFSPTFALLLASRVLQAIGGSLTMSNSIGIVTDIFPGNERGRALGITGTFISLGSMLGPGLAGLILSHLPWHWIFLVNVPVGILAFIVAMVVLPRDIIKDSSPLDLKGFVIFAVGMILFVLGLSLGQVLSYTSPWILVCVGAGVAFFVGFFFLERRTKSPMLSFGLFKDHNFSVGIATMLLMFIGFGCFSSISPFYTQDILGFSAETTGTLMMSFPIAMAIVGPFAGALSDRIGSHILTILGFALFTVGAACLLFAGLSTPFWVLFAIFVVMGAGNGFFQSPNNSMIMSTVPKADLGSAGSVTTLMKSTGIVMGQALSTGLLYGSMSLKEGRHINTLSPGHPEVFLIGMHIVFGFVLALCAIALFLIVRAALPNRRKQSAEPDSVKGRG